MDQKKIVEHQRRFVKDRDWEQFHSPKNLAMALSGEVAELVEIFQWLTEEQSTEVMEDPKKAEAVRHELADILFYLFRISDKLGVDLEEAIWEKFRVNAERYPVELSRGHATKYSELTREDRPQGH